MFRRQDITLLDKTVFGRAIFKPPFKASQALQEEARFVYVVKGNSRLYAPQSHINIQSTDCFIMKCENFVNNWQLNEDDAPNEVIVVQFYPEILQYIYDNKIPDLFSKKNKTIPNPVEKITTNPVIQNYIEGLRFYLDNPSLMNDELVKVKMRELILILVNTDLTGRIQSILSELFQMKEYEFKEIIRAHLYEDLNLEDLAFFAGLSLSSFKRKFKTVFGTSPGVYVKTKRLEKAKELIGKTNQRISEIAYDCGFNDVGYFSKAFAATYNFSPSEYRKSQLD